MAKSKKSKILASMLAVSTMAVFYVAPVMAAEQINSDNNHSSVIANTNGTIDFQVWTTQGDGSQNLARIASFDADGFSIHNGSGRFPVFYIGRHNGDFMAAGGDFAVDADGNVTANGTLRVAGGDFTVDGDGNVVSLGNVTSTDGNITYNLNTVGANTAGIDRVHNSKKGYDTTTIEGTLKIRNDGYISNATNTFSINPNGELKVAGGKFIVDDKTGNVTLSRGNIELAEKATVDGVDVSELEGKFNTTNENVAGIERDPVAETTTIEGDFAVNGKDNTFGSKNGSFTVNAEDGTFTAANGAFKVREGVGETVIAGSLIASEDILGNYGSLNGSQLTLRDVNGNSTAINAGGASFYNGSSGTIISGGAITAKTLNGKVIDNLVEGSDIADDLANIAGISRQQDENGVFYTNIEGTLTVSENGLKAEKNGHAIDVNEDGAFLSSGTAAVYASNNTVGLMADANNYISITNNGIGLKGNVVFDTENYGPYSLSGLVDKVEDIYNRTQGIDYDSSTGTTTIDGNLDVKGDTETGAGGNENVDGNITAGGDITAAGDVYGTNGNFDKVTTGEISADKGNIGNSHFDENGITVGAAGGQHTTITDTTVDATNGYFDNLQADKADIGGVGLESGTVTADKVVTGNTTLDNEGLNVGGQTSVTADGVNVGGNGGTTVSKDGVSIADKTIISDHDVVINEGTADRVSLSETADRVGNLEQGVSELNNRVGELEDRIDKVGAMAAAIANLRTMGYDPAAPTEVAVGIGQYRDETGAALGLFHYPNRDFMLSLSVSTSGDEVMGGIGATWKFGRKSPEKVAEIKKAQAEVDARRAEEAKLAKAEEMKQAAKEAKIKAQQERHAKLAAERAAQAEAAK